MRADPPSITPDTTLEETLEIAWHRGIRHLLVMEGQKLVGIISDGDLQRALAGDAARMRSSTTAREIMTTTVITVAPTITLENACDTMMQEAISALPVVENGVLRGLFTETDALAYVARCE
jgi:acetoin utilization protein AcuB